MGFDYWLTVLTEALIPLAIVVVAYMLRDKVGETEADRIVKLAGQRVARARQYMNAADVAVVAVENGIKKYGSASDEELKAAALDIMARTLEEWGVVINPSNMAALAGLVEYAYQALKEVQLSKIPQHIPGSYPVL